MEIVFFTIIAIALFLLLRNALAYRIQMAALRVVSAKASAAIDQGEGDWMRFYTRYEQRSYESVLFDLTTWTARQAYPWLYELEARD